MQGLLTLSAGHATDRHEIRDRAKEIRLAQEPIDFLLPLAKLTGGDDLLPMGRAADLKKIRTETGRLEDHDIGFDRDIREPACLEQARQLTADPAVLRVVIAIEMEHLSHQTAIADGLEIRFDQRDGAARFRHPDQFRKSSLGIGKIGEEPLGSSDIKRLVRK